MNTRKTLDSILADTQKLTQQSREATVAETDGGADKDRTCDLLNAIQALYQLSYDPIQSGENLTDWIRFVKSNFARFWQSAGRPLHLLLIRVGAEL